MNCDITVVAITGRHIEHHADAIRRTLTALPSHIKAKGLLISPEKPRFWEWEWELSHPFRTRVEWGAYVSHRLKDHINTPFSITVQWDGWGVHQENWTDDFLNYDYIGAPWPARLLIPRPWWGIGRYRTWNVGNGGFALRSERWVQCTALLGASHTPAEDLYLGRIKRREMERLANRFAPEDIACKWSYEHPFKDRPDYRKENSFGFHGKQNHPAGNLSMIDCLI